MGGKRLFDPLSHARKKINSIWVRNLNVKAKIINLIEHIGKYPDNLGVGAKIS